MNENLSSRFFFLFLAITFIQKESYEDEEGKKVDMIGFESSR